MKIVHHKVCDATELHDVDLRGDRPAFTREITLRRPNSPASAHGSKQRRMKNKRSMILLVPVRICGVRSEQQTQPHAGLAPNPKQGFMTQRQVNSAVKHQGYARASVTRRAVVSAGARNTQRMFGLGACQLPSVFVRKLSLWRQVSAPQGTWRTFNPMCAVGQVSE